MDKSFFQSRGVLFLMKVFLVPFSKVWIKLSDQNCISWFVARLLKKTPGGATSSLIKNGLEIVGRDEDRNWNSHLNFAFIDLKKTVFKIRIMQGMV